MGKMMQKVKSVLSRPKRAKAAQKAYDRWEGEGGALPPEDLPERGAKPDKS